jgi:hypothetical protein
MSALPFLILAALALIFSLIAFGLRLRQFGRMTRPADRSPLKGSVPGGVLYAYTLGMMPWAKEGTRIHFIAYMRGVIFHICLFLGLGIFLLSPWLDSALSRSICTALGVILAIGAIFALAGFIMRFADHHLKALSTPDDYFAVLIVSLFLAAEALWLFAPATHAVFYSVSAIMLVYAPYGKIRHCIYFAFSRLFFGKFFGRRAVLPHAQQAMR